MSSPSSSPDAPGTPVAQVETELTLLYRGPLSSCDYDCWYCPFGKKHETAAELKQDRLALERFTRWCRSDFLPPASSTAAPSHRFRWLSVFFTPWGEALIRRWYRTALAELAALPHVRRLAVQTNLSISPKWLEDIPAGDRRKIALWCTWHPSQVSLEQFAAHARQLDALQVRFSAGAVGLREHFDQIEQLRELLPASVYLWINAYRDQPDYYLPGEVERLTAVDPLFPQNLAPYNSLGHPCRSGSSVFSVDGAGELRRCHFIRQPVGNLYETGLPAVPHNPPCSREQCGCHIGYIHMPELQLNDVYGAGLLERIPTVIPPERPPLTSTMPQTATQVSASGR